MRRCQLLALLLLATGFLGAAPGANPEQDRAALRQANVKDDGPGLLAFFKELTPSDKALEDIEALVRDLGNTSFRKRQKASEELIRVGPVARPFLVTASRSKDLEVARRATDCLAAIEQRGKPELIAAAARMLAAKKPDGTVKALLDYLPFAEVEYLAEEIHSLLPRVGFDMGKADPTLTKALDDRLAIRRAAAAEAFLKAGTPAERLAMRRFLKDADAAVRTRIAFALVELKEREAVPVLIEAAPVVPREQFWQIEQILNTLAGDKAPKVEAGTGELERREFRSAWRKWWNDNGEKVDLAALTNDSRSLGLTLLVSLDQRVAAGKGGVRALLGRVFEVGRDGKVRWQIEDLNYPIDAQVVGPDRVVIAEYRTRIVSERTIKGEVIWQKQCDNFPVGVQRLPGGNTLIVQRNAVIEVNRSGEQVATIPANLPNGICGARRARNGETIILERTGACVRLDAKGAEAKRVQLNAVVSIIGTQFDVLPNGNILVPNYSQNQVAEYDPDGKQVWNLESPRPTTVSRLPNGNTLIGSRYSKTLIEVDRAGKKVWEYESPNGTLLNARRR